MGKRILIVDDEKSTVFFLSENLTELGSGYEIETAGSGEEALHMIANHPFDLVITDLRMPGVDGLGLIEAIRATNPKTRLILMTAYGSDEVEASARRLEVYRYITKPFRVEELIDAARDALEGMAVNRKGMLILSDQRFEAITRRLEDLRGEIGAQCILLADTMGQPLARVGIAEGLDERSLISLIGAGFATSFELARHLAQEGALNLSYQEGATRDVYATNVGENLFLVMVFDKRLNTGRIGVVWLYTRRAIKDLLEITADAEHAEAGQMVGNDFGDSVDLALDAMITGMPDYVLEPALESAVDAAESSVVSPPLGDKGSPHADSYPTGASLHPEPSPQELERKRYQFARELLDGPAQAFSQALYGLRTLKPILQKDPQLAIDELTKLEASLQKGLDATLACFGPAPETPTEHPNSDTGPQQESSAIRESAQNAPLKRKRRRRPSETKPATESTTANPVAEPSPEPAGKTLLSLKDAIAQGILPASFSDQT
jgi:CheY-like chemotaxis protein